MLNKFANIIIITLYRYYNNFIVNIHISYNCSYLRNYIILYGKTYIINYEIIIHHCLYFILLFKLIKYK